MVENRAEVFYLRGITERNGKGNITERLIHSRDVLTGRRFGEIRIEGDGTIETKRNQYRAE